MTYFFHSHDGLVFEHRAVIRLNSFVMEDVVAGDDRHHAGYF